MRPWSARLRRTSARGECTAAAQSLRVHGGGLQRAAKRAPGPRGVALPRRRGEPFRHLRRERSAETQLLSLHTQSCPNAGGRCDFPARNETGAAGAGKARAALFRPSPAGNRTAGSRQGRSLRLRRLSSGIVAKVLSRCGRRRDALDRVGGTAKTHLGRSTGSQKTGRASALVSRESRERDATNKRTGIG